MADAKKNPLGPVGERLRANLEQLRGRMSYRELADELARQGRPIPTLGLSRVEKGERRVDADDLVALALVLGVTPNRLLLSEYAGVEEIPLTPETAVPASSAWKWADGQFPLPDAAGESSTTLDKLVAWQVRTRPKGTSERHPIIRQMLFVQHYLENYLADVDRKREGYNVESVRRALEELVLQIRGLLPPDDLSERERRELAQHLRAMGAGEAVGGLARPDDEG